MPKESKKKPAKKGPKQPELPHVEGPGVGQIRISAVDRAAADYFEKKELRCQMTPEEVKAKKKLLDLLHKHRDEIGRDEHDVLRYAFDDKVIILSPGEEKLTVKKAKQEILEQD